MKFCQKSTPILKKKSTVSCCFSTFICVWQAFHSLLVCFFHSFMLMCFGLAFLLVCSLATETDARVEIMKSSRVPAQEKIKTRLLHVLIVLRSKMLQVIVERSCSSGYYTHMCWQMFLSFLFAIFNIFFTTLSQIWNFWSLFRDVNTGFLNGSVSVKIIILDESFCIDLNFKTTTLYLSLVLALVLTCICLFCFLNSTLRSLQFCLFFC